ncbi:MAG TPA: TonB family protein [Pseudolabrys sp.]|jgi:protein TonB|nr:TonB family protein [Pseudolabrys sp.]
MNVIGDTPAMRRWPEGARWAACFALAVAFHGAGAAALLARWNDDDLVANAPVITIELAALPVAPETTPNEIPPGPQQQAAQPEPEPEKPLEKELELPPDPKAEPLQAVMPPPKVAEKPDKKPKQRHASVASAPSSADTKAERAAAPMAGANSQNPNALPNWKSQLVAQLERNKRYPPEAQSRGEQGIAQLAFSIDRSGGVHNARITRSSGSSALDQATLALVARAAPLPPPPPEIAGSQIPISVPIRYNMR